MNERPIGVFDSGVGGLTVVRELQRILPDEDIVYLGDTGRVPYGTRSKDTIRRYASQDIRFLLTKGVKAVVAACGTVSTILGEADLQQMGVQVPYTGVVLPSAQHACALSARGRIGVIATTAAIRSGAYGRAVRSIYPGAQVFGKACPLLVSLAENGITAADNQIARLTVEMYLQSLIAEQIDTLILGCTHFPLFYDIINDVLNYEVTLIDSGASAAKELKKMLCDNGLQSQRGRPGSARYYVTDSPESFEQVAQEFLGAQLQGKVEYVDIENIEQ